ncbi:MAG: mechanosensitive ion channel family protein [Acidimicrobiia bacterium]
MQSSDITGWLTDTWDRSGREIITTIGVVAAAWIVLRLARRAVRRWEQSVTDRFGNSDLQAERERAQRIVTIADVLRLTIAITVWVVAILTVMAIWGLPMSPFIAVGTTVGVAVGFGAQDVVRDIIAGFLILIEDQYSIGDVVEIAGVSGTVEAIMLRTTVLRDLDGNRHFVPNGQIKVASNLTSKFSRLVVDVPVSYDTDLDDAMRVVADEANSLASDDEWRQHFIEPPEMLGVNQLADSSVLIRVVMTLTTEGRWVVKREFLRRIKKRLDREGIEIPFNQLSIRTVNPPQAPESGP